MTTEKRIVRRGFTLTEKDLETLRQAVEKCGYVSDSEALRAILRFYAEHAPCLKT
jgi:Arc/MetJ-type ribon-helix-helix transcriptional regulator